MKTGTLVYALAGAAALAALAWSVLEWAALGIHVLRGV